MRDGPIRREDDGKLARLTIDHPPLNLFDRELTEALAAVVADLGERRPRAALFRAEGKFVSAGVDVKLFEGATPAEGTAHMSELMAITHAVEALPFPTLFAAHGLTLTAAFELALACDMIVAAESARFGLVEARVGITPGMGGTQRLARIAGPNRAREFVMTADLYPAQTMAEWGVVNRVHADEELDRAARGLAAELASGPTCAHAATKEIIRTWSAGGVDAADRIAPEVVGALYGTDDFDEGVRSLLAKGPGEADFRGA